MLRSTAVHPTSARTAFGNDLPGRQNVAAEHTRISPGRAFGLVLPGLALLDVLMVTGGFFAAVQLTPGAREAVHQLTPAVAIPLAALMVVLVASFLCLGGMFGLYSRRILHNPRRALATAGRALFWSGLVAVVFDFLLALDPPGDLRRLLMAHALILTAGVFTVRPVLSRLILRLAEVGPFAPRRILVVGGSPEARRAAAALEAEPAGQSVVIGLAETEPWVKGPGQRWPRFRLSCWQELSGLAHALAADEVLIATERIQRGEAVEQACALHRRGIETMVVPHLTRMYVDAAPVTREAGVPLLRVGAVVSDGIGLRAKRAFDVALSAIMALIFAPVMLLVALLVKLTSPGPVLYAQERVGKDGRHFNMLKFRSMKVSNDDSHHREYVTSLMRQGDAAGLDPSGRPIYKIVDDPRVTWLGWILRRTSLDELPQLINVLRGEMSLIGPRPCLPFEYDLYEEWHKRRLDVMPGMTGLWQVSGRSLLSFEEMILLDLYYGANWSFALDVKLLGRTIPEVLYARGAR